MVDNRAYVDTEFLSKNDLHNNILNFVSPHVEHTV